MTKDLRLHWLTPFSGQLSDLESVNLASVRLRAAVALRAAEGANWHYSFGPQIDLKPRATDLCLVVGDVTSTMACAITAKKCGVAVAHVEAGIRSGDWGMPEEVNRVVTDSVADMFFTTPTP